MENKRSTGSSTIFSSLYDGLCDYGDLCSQYRETSSSPPLKIVNLVYDSPTKMTPLSPPVEEHQNLDKDPDTPEKVLAARAKKKKKPKKRC